VFFCAALAVPLAVVFHHVSLVVALSAVCALFGVPVSAVVADVDFAVSVLHCYAVVDGVVFTALVTADSVALSAPLAPLLLNVRDPYAVTSALKAVALLAVEAAVAAVIIAIFILNVAIRVI
jgi:hypothetical protein